MWALVAVGAISFLLWAHHMFTAGLGTMALTGTFLSAWIRLAMTCHVVPSTDVPDSKACTALV